MRTTGIKCVVLSVVLTLLLSLVRGDVADVEVSCGLMESCILPCSFQGGADAVIHWIQVTGNTPVHSYYHDQDQLARQDQRFSGRTSLFKDQISTGNASLRLTGVEVQDQGRYKCYTSTISGHKESFINLKVDDAAPADPQSVLPDPTQCSTEGEDGCSSLGGNAELVVGIVVSALAVVGVTGLMVFYFYKKRNTQDRQPASPQNSQPVELIPLQEANGGMTMSRQSSPPEIEG